MGSRGRGPRPGPRPAGFPPAASPRASDSVHTRAAASRRGLFPGRPRFVLCSPDLVLPRDLGTGFSGPLEAPPAALLLTVILYVCAHVVPDVTCLPDPRPAASGSSRAGSVSVHLDNLVPSRTVLALLGCSALNKREQTNKGTPESQCAEFFSSWRPPG